jgi:hypothetical protein
MYLCSSIALSMFAFVALPSCLPMVSCLCHVLTHEQPTWFEKCVGKLRLWRDPPSLVEKLLSGGDIKVTKGAWRVPKWRAFVVSQMVLLGEIW